MNEGWTLQWTGSPWVVAGVAAGAAVALLLAVRGARPWRALELGLLSAALAIVVAAAGGPAWVREGERVVPAPFLVLVDASRSMGVLDGGAPRIGRLREVLDAVGPAEVFHFGGALHPGMPSGADQADSDLAAALADLGRRYAGERVEGIALVSDGIDRHGLAARLRDPTDAVLAGLPGPLTVIQAGQDGEYPDVSIRDVRAGSFAFLRESFPISVDVRSRAMPSGPVTVSLRRDGQPVATRSVDFAGGPDAEVTFDVRPDRVGRFTFEASIAVAPGDRVPANNAMSVAVRVVRDRVRVLQVAGAPSLDEKFLRLFLKEDPGIDLVSFFILRTPEDFGSGYAPEELSLIEFPYEKLFSSELGTFDVVILQDFDFRPFFGADADELIENLATYVERGHALAMVGGEQSFDAGGWGDTALARVLPVTLGVRGDKVDATPFRPVLSEVGARHPVTRMAADPGENARAWEQLSELDGANLVAGLRPGASALLVHPALRAGDAQLPVLAVGPAKKGRAMALLADSSWRWSLAEAGAGRGNQAYLRAWKNALRWLIADPEDEPLAAEPARENVRPGEPNQLIVRARGLDYAPAAGATVEVEVDGPGGRLPVSGTAGADGVLAVDLPTEERGAYRAKVQARGADGEDLGEAQVVYAVVTRDPELDEIAPDRGLLSELAARASGSFVGADATIAVTRDAGASRRVLQAEVSRVGDSPLVPVAAGVLAAASWWLRRRGGYR